VPHIRCAIYARYSSDLQRPTSIDDQVRNCRTAAEKNGWVVLDEFIRSDSELTGRTVVGRQGLADLMRLAETKPRPFDSIIIDDSSRLGRYLPDVLMECDQLMYNGVFLYFASDRLDSREESFRIVHLVKGYGDERYIKDLREKVHRGQTGCVLKGYTPGGRTYGYRNVNIEDPHRKGDHGRPAVIGVVQETIPEEAKVVLRIFEMYAAGASYATIAKTFNREGIQSPQSPHRRSVRAWHPSAIREMLRNELYRGVRLWNRTETIFNPRNGKSKQRPRPESEWIRKEVPELRIISDDLWNRVREQNRLVCEKHGPKTLGGMNRTPNSRRYLFSGLMACGLCGGNITIASGQVPNARYGCLNHRSCGVCENKVTIPQRKLEQQLISALAVNLLDPRVEELRAEEFSRQLKLAMEQEAKLARDAASQHSNLKQKQSELRQQAANLTDAIKKHGISQFLSAELAAVESALGDIERCLTAKLEPKIPTVSEKDIREFLRHKAETFCGILTSDPARARQELQKRIKKLILTPRDTPNGPVLEVTGDVALFARDGDVMQTNSLEGIAQHYSAGSIPIAIVLDPSFPLAA